MNVLNLARSKIPESIQHPSYIKLLVRLLVLTGDIKQVRWVIQNALQELSAAEVASVDQEQAQPPQSSNNPDKKTANPGAVGVETGKGSRVTKSTGSIINETPLRRQLELLEMFISAETTLGCPDIKHLNRLRDQRHKVKMQLEDIEKAKLGAVSSGREDLKLNRRGLFDTASELIERYESCSFDGLPDLDEEVKDRCKGRSSVETLTRIDGNSGPPSNANSRRDRDSHRRHEDDGQVGVPSILRDFIGKLPALVGPAPDIDTFLRHIRNVILPPRPPEETTNVKMEESSNKNDEESEWNREGAPEDDNNNGYHYSMDVDQDDVFRQRQRVANFE